MSAGFKFEVEKPWSHRGAPVIRKVTFEGHELGLQDLVNIAESMRLKLLEFGIETTVAELAKGDENG